jgi:hypothetical protein
VGHRRDIQPLPRIRRVVDQRPPGGHRRLVEFAVGGCILPRRAKAASRFANGGAGGGCGVVNDIARNFQAMLFLP